MKMFRAFVAAALGAICFVGAAPLARAQRDEAPDIQTAAMSALEQGRLSELVAALEEFAADLPPNLPDHERAIHLMDLVEVYGVEAQFVGRLPRAQIDERAARFYEEALRLTPLEARYEVENDYAYYLNVTNQTGRAMAHFRAALRDPHIEGAPDAQYVALGQIAAAYMDMGQLDYAAAALARARSLESRFDEPARTVMHLALSPLAMNLAYYRGEYAAIGALWRADRRLISSQVLSASERVGLAFAYLSYLNLIDDRENARDAEALMRANAVEGLAGEVRRLPLADQRLYARTLIDCMIYTLGGNPVLLARDEGYVSAVAACDEFTGSLPFLQGQLQFTRARVLELQGRDEAALEIYRAMTEHAESVRGTYSVDHRSDFFSGRWRIAYEGIARIHARAFVRQPSSVYSFASLVVALDRTRARQYAELRNEVNRIGSPQEALRLAQSLPEGTTVVAFSMHEHELIALGFTRTQRRAAIVDVSISALNERINLIRGLLQDADSDPAEIDALLDSLSEDALGSVRELLAGAQEIIVIADGPLARLPFGLMTAADDGAPIGLDANVSYALSLRSLNVPTTTQRGEGFFAAGAPVYPVAPPDAPLDDGADFQDRRAREFGEQVSLQSLPFARRELVTLAGQIDPNARPALSERTSRGYEGPHVRLLLGDAATETAVRQGASRARYVHLATHGLLAGDFGLLEPALVLGAGDGGDGFLTASEIEALTLSADLTVLSACSSGDGRIAMGEGVLGLARAFLIAGSDEVLVSMWPVNDAATARWMSIFYEQLRSGAQPREALRATMREMRQTYPEPKYWAPFVLVRG